MYTTITSNFSKARMSMLKTFLTAISTLPKATLIKGFTKVITLCVFAMALVACSSAPQEKAFVGPGQFNPQDAAKTRVSLGLTYLKNGNNSQAKYNLDKALEFAPRSGEANYAMAFYYQQVGEVARAEEYYQTAIGYSRNDPDVLNSYGAFLCKQSRYDEAKAYFLQAVDDKSYVSTAETYENLAICAQSQGLDAEAIAYFNSALNHQPTRTSSLFYMAQSYIETSQWEEAKKALWKYERNAQVSADSLWMSYQIAQGQNNLKTATEYAELLRSMYPQDEKTKTALAQLGKFRPSMAVTQKSRVKRTQVESPVLSQEPPPAPVEETSSAIEAATSNIQAQADELPVLTTDLPEPVLEPANEVKQEVAVLDETVTQEMVLAPEETVAATVETAPEEITTAIVEESDAESNIIVNESDVEAYQALLVKMKEDAEAQEALAKAAEAETEAYHIVLPKENLYRISLKYNVKMKKLLEWNNLTDASDIRIGTKLRVRAPNINE